MSTVFQGASGSNAHSQTTCSKRKLPSTTAIRQLEVPAARTAQQPHSPHCSRPSRLIPSRPTLGTRAVCTCFPREVTCCECVSSCQFTLALNLTPRHQHTSRILGPSSQSASFLPGDRTLSSPGNPCLPSPKELRVLPRTLDLDQLSDNRRWAETTQRHSGYTQNNRHPMKSRD